jgi:amino acid transporter
VPIIIYNLLGCELVSSAAGEMKDPVRDVPKAVILSAIAIAALYLISTLLIWVIVPASQISVSSGIIQMFVIAFGGGLIGKVVTIFIGLLVLTTLFTGVVAWTLGQNRSVAEAAKNGEMPGLFGLTNQSGAPVGAALVSGVISTIVILAYWFLADNAAEMFWYVTSFCLVLELLAYLFLFPAFITLRMRDKNVNRPYRVPGPTWLVYFMAGSAEMFLLLAIILLCIQPGKEFVWAALPIIVGTIITVLIGEGLIRVSENTGG